MQILLGASAHVMSAVAMNVRRAFHRRFAHLDNARLCGTLPACSPFKRLPQCLYPVCRVSSADGTPLVEGVCKVRYGSESVQCRSSLKRFVPMERHLQVLQSAFRGHFGHQAWAPSVGDLTHLDEEWSDLASLKGADVLPLITDIGLDLGLDGSNSGREM